MSNDVLQIVSNDVILIESETESDILEISTPGPQGVVGPAGPAGPAGPSGASGDPYEHDQMISSTVWTINHNLGRFPVPNFFDSANDQIEGYIVHVNNNQLTVTFSAAVSGKGYM